MNVNFCKILIYLIQICLVSSKRDMNMNSKQSFIAQALEKNLIKYHLNHSQIGLLSQLVNETGSEGVNSQSLIATLKGKILELIENKKKALKRIVDNLEESTKEYTWSDNIKRNHSGLVFLNMTTEEKYKDNPGEMSETFGVRINRSLTGIHVPIEIYEGYPEVLNGLKWSSSVDEVFKKNLEEDSSLSWQYFATKAGFMRLYPAVTRWHIPPPYDVDLFDAERRPWYIQGSTSPKDVIILMDRSGSVHGQTFTIMKFAVQTLLDTLGENDYVNVAAFNESTYWVSDIIYKEKPVDPRDCRNYSESLLQANHINKKSLIDDIQALTDVGMSNYTSALEFAYEVFKERANNRENSANCHKLVMLFSDGGTDWPEAVFERFENDSDTTGIRIFTYAIGAHPIPTAVLQQMACKTGGKFTTITTSSGVRTKIQESYISTISEPLAESKSHPFQITSAYTSGLTENLTLSLTMPVFNLSKGLEDKNELIGVAGIDIPIHHLQKFVSHETLGPLGYPFIINQNGFLLMHPRLHAQSSYLENPPHLDLLDLELNPDKLEETRRSMIDLKMSTHSITGKLLLDYNHVMDEIQMQYTFAKIDGTSYSVGIAMKPDSKHLNLEKITPTSNLSIPGFVLAPWNFCGTQASGPDPSYLKQYAKDHFKNCEPKLRNGLNWASNWMYKLQKEWLNNPSDENIINKAIYTRFGLAFITNSITKIDTPLDLLNSTNATGSQLKQLSITEMYGREWRNPNENPALKQGVIREGVSIFPHRKGAFISKPAYVSFVPVAAVGINVTSDLLDEMLRKALSPHGFDSYHVLFVDESATIIASSFHERSSGEFLGERWPNLLKNLVSVKIYSTVNVSNYQAMCDGQQEAHGEISSGIRLDFFSPFKYFGTILLQLLSLVEYLQLTVFHMFLTSSPSEVYAAHKTAGKQSCIIEHTIYYLTNSQDYKGTIPCLGTEAKIMVRHTNTLNAVLIFVEKSLVDMKCDGTATPSAIELMGGPAGTDHEFFNPMRKRIVRPKQLACLQPRYRKGPSECQMSSIKKCSKGTGLHASLSLLLTALLVLRC